MSLHNPFDRNFFMLGGAVKTSGGSLGLVKGQLGLFNLKESTAQGIKAIASAAGIPKDSKVLELRMGTEDKGFGRSYSNKSMNTLPFSLDEVVEVRVSAPEITEQKVDEIIIGYDGHDPSKAFNFKAGDTFFRLSLELEGDAIAYRGAAAGGPGAEREIVSVNIEIPQCDVADNCGGCDNCTEIVDPKEVVLETIKRLRRKELAGGAKVEDFVEITPVFECDTPASVVEVPYDYYCLEVCDSGTASALSAVAEQYDTAVSRIERKGATSTYQILLPRTAGAPAAYNQTISSIIKGCEDCPAGFTATSEGVLYAIDMEDNGSDQTAAVQALPGAVASSAEKAPGTSAGLGFYTVVLDDELTDAEITAFLAVNTSTASATLKFVGEVSAICENGTVTPTNWTNCGSCNVIEETYRISLQDDECGNNRLEELNSNYSQTVTLAESETESTSTITLTGTSGTANVNIAGADYLATFDTDLETTALNFDIDHSATLAALNISIVADGDTIIVTGDNSVLSADPTVTGDTGDLGGSATALVPAPLTGGCRTSYEMNVVSNIVCDECDDIFKDFYVTEAPEPYDLNDWTKVSGDSLPTGNCLTGIRFKGKTFGLSAEECLRDQVGFIETSTKIRVSAGYPVEVREGIGNRPKSAYETTQISRWVPRTHLAGNLRSMENESNAYFLGRSYRGDFLSRLIRGEVSNLEDNHEQYVHYTLQVRPKKNTQGFGARIGQDINYGIYVKVGEHNSVEDLINDIASHAGVKTVKAFG